VPSRGATNLSGRLRDAGGAGVPVTRRGGFGSARAGGPLRSVLPSGPGDDHENANGSDKHQ
jgi:hypothetical protein